MPPAWGLRSLWCLIRAVSPAAPCPFVSLSQGAVVGTLWDISTGTVRGQHKAEWEALRVDSSAWGGVGGLAAGPGLQAEHLSFACCACSPGARRDRWDPGRMGGHAKVHFLGRSFLKHIPSLCTSSSGTFEADALRTVCDGEPAPRCSACEQPPVRCPEVQPLHPPEHPRKRVVSAPRYSCLYISSGLKKCPSPALHPKDAQRACPGCTAPTRIWDPSTWDPLWRARDGREQWGHLPSCRPSRS